MRMASILVLVAAVSVGTVIMGHCSEMIEINVRVIADRPPGDVTINVEDEVQTIPLKQAPVNTNYRIAIPRPTPKANGAVKLVSPYLLVASWDEEKEQLYIGLRPLTPDQIELTIYHKAYECDVVELRKIALLGKDPDSLLRKYFRARNFYKIWLLKTDAPKSDPAIHSARLWFEAAVALANPRKSFYRMDEEIKKIVQEYEELSEKDQNFAKFYRKHFPSVYLTDNSEQLVAQEYGIVGEVEKLARLGKFEKANELNKIALTAFSKETKENQEIISSQQRINMNLLMNNSKYIAARLDSNRR